MTDNNDFEAQLPVCPDCGKEMYIFSPICECGSQAFNLTWNAHEGVLSCVCAQCSSLGPDFEAYLLDDMEDGEPDFENIEPEGEC